MRTKLLSIVLFFLLIAQSAIAQAAVKSIDLSGFCPDEEDQYKSTCYAYAVTYTAMSTEFNILNGITDRKTINDNWFSPGIVMSYNNSQLPIWDRSPRCGKWGTAEKALVILKTVGTTFSKDYHCDCKAFSKVERNIASKKTCTIKDFAILPVTNVYSDASVNWIKTALAQKHPVIIAVYQNDQLRSVKNPEFNDNMPDQQTLNTIAMNSNGSSNHVVCILGYNDEYKDGKGYFLIKNNYNSWGNGKGYSWVPYTFILPLINEAYYITGIQ